MSLFEWKQRPRSVVDIVRRPIDLADGVDYTTPDFEEVEQPVLTKEYGGAILVKWWVYVYATDYEVESYVGPNGERLDPASNYVIPKLSKEVFTFPSGLLRLGERYALPANVKNLQTILTLPLVDEDTMLEAVKQINLWEYMLPMTMFLSIMLKTGAQIPEGNLPPHRLPMLSRSVTTTTYRTPTHDELVAVSMGFLYPDLSVTETTTEYDVYKDCLKYQKHSIGGLKLYSQQLIAAHAINLCKRIPLWMDMRTGKTMSAIVAAKQAYEDREVDRIIVLCPVTNMYSPWVPELEREGFNVCVLDDTKEMDYCRINTEFDNGFPTAYVINYERVGSRRPMMEEAWDMERLFVIADETSAIKNPISNRTRETQLLCRDPLYVVLLNGTPMEQGPHDLWSQMKCVDVYGVKWGQRYGDFIFRWLDMVAPGKYVVRKEFGLDFEMLISSCSIRYIRPEADQFSGKDKTFRHVIIKPTQEIYDQTAKIAAGFLETIDGMSGDVVIEKMTSTIIRTYGFWREVACGYDKYRCGDEGPYSRTRHKLDPKLLWINSYISANPTQPLIIYCEFNEQEQRLKEMLDNMGVKWASTKPLMNTHTSYRLKDSVPLHVWNGIREHFPENEAVNSIIVFQGMKDIVLPPWIRYDEEIVSFVRSKFNQIVYYETFVDYVDSGPYAGEYRAREVDRFNKGEVKIFILKWAQGRGISLNCKEAVNSGIGTYPAIISLAPCWSLGSWEQGQDRAVCTDDRTGKNVNTLIYSLSIKGTIEQKILRALRMKKGVQATLLRDIERKGFSSFVEDMLEDMKSAMNEEGGEFFDSEEMNARILLGVPPFSKLTESIIRNSGKDKYKDRIKYRFGKVTNQTASDWFKGLPREDNNNLYNEDVEISKAFDMLIERCNDERSGSTTE